MSEPIFGIPPDLVRGPEADFLPMAGEANWGMSKLKIDSLRIPTDGGKRIKVCVVDTGIDDSHPLLAPNFKKGKDFTGSSIGYRDRHGHGTHTSGTVGASDPNIGVAYRCDLYHAKGLGDSGSGGNSIIQAIEWGASEGCTIISCSLGGGGPVPSWERVLKDLADRGIWIFFSAGNSGPNTPEVEYPARYEHVMASGALRADLTAAGFSNSGRKLDCMGPGQDIWSCRPGGGFSNMSGTSMSCPFNAGTAALYRRGLELANRPIPNIYELRKKFIALATDLSTPGYDVRTGWGYLTPVLMAMDLIPDPVIE